MKPCRIFLLVFFVFSLQTIFAFGKKDNQGDEVPTATTEKSDDYVKIDLFLDTTKENPKNHFNWKTKSESCKDYFDALSGASKFHSTKKFREATYDSQTKVLKVPKGLRNLGLFAVSNPENRAKDEFKISRIGETGKKIQITFTHRKIFYKIESDEQGTIFVPESFYIKFPEQQDDTKKDNNIEDMSNSEAKNEDSPIEKSDISEKSDEEKESEQISEDKNRKDSDGYTADTPGDFFDKIFRGKLRANLDENGIFTLKGKIKLENREKDKKSEETDTENEKVAPDNQI